MNRIIRFLSFMIMIFVSIDISGQEKNIVSGEVCNKHGEPLTGANVYIYATIDGDLSDSIGHFSFTTSANGEITLKCTYLGYAAYERKVTLPYRKNLKIRMKPESVSLNDVEIVVSSFNFGQTDRMKSMKPLDVVMSGNSCGDIVASLHSLPGVQTVGENGRLYVRGGDNTETQFFINGMHVLQPYDTEPNNTVTRSRFSPFLFKGINFSLGGYDSEYGQALSSVLPMETKDVELHDKFGLNFSPLSMAAGGNKSFSNSALSFNTEYQDLRWYNKIFPDKYDWNEPFRKFSHQMQYKIESSGSTVIKNYAGYDHTSLNYHIDDINDNQRDMDMSEDNIYLNSVLKTNFNHGWSWFTGAAWSWVRSAVKGAMVPNDKYIDQKSEIHLKTRLTKSVSNSYKFSVGMEDYIRHFHKGFALANTQQSAKMRYNSLAAFLENQLKLISKMYLNASLRMENYVGHNDVYFMPRISLSYIPNNKLQLSALYGRYSQVIGDEFDIYNNYIKNESFANHYILSIQYKLHETTFRVEAYDKTYSHLPLYEELQQMTFNGKGHSYGFDLFLEKKIFQGRLNTTLSYSYNHSRRKYMQYPDYVQPQYATTHGGCLSLKYNVPQIKSIFGLSENITSGRPYTDPSQPGMLQKRTKPYLSTGVNVSFLASPSVILYASVTNILNRHNVFNYQYQKTPGAEGSYNRTPVEASRDRFCYIGIFISLKKSHAYEISNF